MKTTLLFSVLFSMVCTTSLQAQQWESLGSNDFDQPTTHEAYEDYIFKQDSKGTLYVAYAVGNYIAEKRIIVSKKSDNSWETLGGSGSIVGRFEYSASIGFTIDKYDNVYISFSDYDKQDKITVKKWDGNSWEIIGNAGFSSGSVLETSIVIDDSGNPYVLYDDESHNYHMTVKKWDGNSWVIIGAESFTEGGLDSSIGIDSKGNPYVIYTNYSKGFTSLEKWNGSNWEIIVKESEDWIIWMGLDSNDTIYTAVIENKNNFKATVKTWNGNSWNILGDSDLTEEGVEDITIGFNSSRVPYVAYAIEYYKDGYLIQKIMSKKWNGTSWQTLDNKGFLVRGRLDGPWTENAPTRLSMTIDKSEIPYISYSEYLYNFKVKIRNFNGISWVPVGETGISERYCYGRNSPSLAVGPSDTPFIFYLEIEPDNVKKGKVIIKKNNGNTWETIGNTESYSASIYGYLGLVIDSSGNPLVAFSDCENGNKATVIRWNGNIWETIGVESFSDENRNGVRFALDFADVPYIAYEEDHNIIVKKFNGSNWETVGETGIYLPYSSDHFCLAIDFSGTPFIASESGSVKRFNGSTWETLGDSYVMEKAFKSSLTFDTTGTPYISYGLGDSYSQKYYTTVKKFNGSRWETLWEESSSYGRSSLVFDAKGDLYLAYPDNENFGTVSVKKFDGNDWKTIGSERFTAGVARSLDLAIDNSGNLTLLYFDNHYIFAKKFTTGVVAVPHYADTSSNVLIYPNPTSDSFKVSIDKTYNSIEVEIYDILGKKLLSVKNNIENIDISTLNNGIYILRIITDNGEASKKLIVNR